jgi:hypothetical protein
MGAIMSLEQRLNKLEEVFNPKQTGESDCSGAVALDKIEAHPDGAALLDEMDAIEDRVQQECRKCSEHEAACLVTPQGRHGSLAGHALDHPELGSRYSELAALMLAIVHGRDRPAGADGHRG